MFTAVWNHQDQQQQQGFIDHDTEIKGKYFKGIKLKNEKSLGNQDLILLPPEI